jgi:hypothetical protein
MKGNKKKPPQTKRPRIAKLLEKGCFEHQPLLSDAAVAKELSGRRGRTKKVKRGKRTTADIKEGPEAFGYTCCDSEGWIKSYRVAVWEVLDVHRETNNIAKTADYFGWHSSLVRAVLEYAKAHPRRMRRFLVLERIAKLGTTTLNLSAMTTEQLEQMAYELESGEPG